MGQAKKTLKKLKALIAEKQQARLGVLEHSISKEGLEAESMKAAYLLICEMSDLVSEYWHDRQFDERDEDSTEPDEDGDERWKFVWEAVGYGTNRDSALANAKQWVDLNDPKGEANVGHRPERKEDE